MSTELELVHDYMGDVEVEESELLAAWSILDSAINKEREIQAGAVPFARRPGARRSRRVARWSAGIAAIAATILLTLQILPASKATIPVSAAAAQIAKLVDGVKPLPPLREGQWSSYQLRGDLTANVEVQTEPPTTTSASVPFDLSEWSNATGASCTSQQLGAASFATPADAQAWHAVGLVDTPANQPSTGCSINSGADGMFPVLDGSQLPHDPATLVTQLQSGPTGKGSTGIPEVDGAAYDTPDDEAAFCRLTLLLVGPIAGAWPGLGQELLRTMALLPGVVPLGTSTTNSGKEGLAFTSGPQPGVAIPVVVLDPNSGSLLEARDLDMMLLASGAWDFVGSSSAPVANDGGGYGLTARWIDPVASPEIVDQSTLPSWTSDIHIVEAVLKSTTTSAQVNALAQPFLAKGDIWAGSEDKAGTLIASDITVDGTSADERTLVAALTTSGLFESISVKM